MEVFLPKKRHQACCSLRAAPCSGEEFCSQFTLTGPSDTPCMRDVSSRVTPTQLQGLYDAPRWPPSSSLSAAMAAASLWHRVPCSRLSLRGFGFGGPLEAVGLYVRGASVRWEGNLATRSPRVVLLRWCSFCCGCAHVVWLTVWPTGRWEMGTGTTHEQRDVRVFTW
jgi:hypothetical protein